MMMIARLRPLTWRAVAAGAAVLGLLPMHLTRAQAVSPDDVFEHAQRAEIARERSAIEATHRLRLAECQHRFAVTGCIEEARRIHRQALAPLRQRSHVLDDDQRKRRAASRTEGLRAKTVPSNPHESVASPKAGMAAAASSPSSSPVSSIPARKLDDRPVEAVPKPDLPATLAQPPVGARKRSVDTAREQNDRERLEARQRELQLRRSQVEQRHAERLKAGKMSPPLSVPPEAAQAASSAAK
jgi:colicin import membrane protein